MLGRDLGTAFPWAFCAGSDQDLVKILYFWGVGGFFSSKELSGCWCHRPGVRPRIWLGSSQSPKNPNEGIFLLIFLLIQLQHSRLLSSAPALKAESVIPVLEALDENIPKPIPGSCWWCWWCRGFQDREGDGDWDAEPAPSLLPSLPASLDREVAAAPGPPHPSPASFPPSSRSFPRWAGLNRDERSRAGHRGLGRRDHFTPPAPLWTLQGVNSLSSGKHFWRRGCLDFCVGAAEQQLGWP